MAINTHDLSRMPEIELFRRTLQSLAMTESILHYRFGNDVPPAYAFDAHWGATDQVGSWNNMQGDDFFAVFCPAGCWLTGFAHEAGTMTPFRHNPPRIWPGLHNGMSEVFKKYVEEPAFEATYAATFCIWRLRSDTQWSRGLFELPPQETNLPPEFQERFQDPDLSGMILSSFERTSPQWAQWEEEQMESSIDKSTILRIFDHVPLTSAMVRALSPDIPIANAVQAAHRIGYPTTPELKRAAKAT